MMAGQALEAAEVGHDGHLGLPHREDGIGAGQPDVAGGGQVDPTADAVAVDGGDDRQRAVGHRRSPRPGGGGSRPGPTGPGRPSTAACRCRRPMIRSVPDMATRSSPTLKWGPRAAITTARISGSEPMAAMARGRSDQNAGPMALRFSGRSSHRVATCPSVSRVRTSEENDVDGRYGRRSHGSKRRPHVPAGSCSSAARSRSGPAERCRGGPGWTGSMDGEARNPGLLRARGSRSVHLHP